MRTSGSRHRAIQSAALLFQRQGYAETGVAEVIERSGTPKGSFYFNFPGGKEQLAREAIDLAGARLTALIDKLAAVAHTPLAFLSSLTNALAAGLEASQFAQGCPIATVALETAATSEPLRAAADVQFTAWEDAIAHGLASNRRPRRRHRRQAAVVLVMLEGALLMARVRRTTEPLCALEHAFRSILEI
jgi:TetR/AcrR family transcriptional regulator, lmrAB and yxaGH operons repressor